MAVTSTIEYCTDINLLEVYPGLSGFDLTPTLKTLPNSEGIE